MSELLIQNNRKKKIKRYFAKFRNPFTVIAFIILSVYSFSLIYAFTWGVLTSLKSRSDFVMNLFGLPKEVYLSNYVIAFTQFYDTTSDVTERVFLPRLILNTLIYAGGHALITTFSTAMCAYVCNKYKNWLTKLMYNVVIFMMILPVVSSLGADIQFNKMLGLYNNLLGMFYTCIGFMTGNFLVSYAMFAAVSWNYAEAAFIDGASNWRVMLHIYFPLVRVPCTVLLVLAFIGFWNNYYTPLIYLPDFPVMATALYRFQWRTDTIISKTPVQMAAAMICCAPCVVLFLIFKDKMIGNLTMGGLKG